MAIEAEGLCPLVQVFDMPRSVRFYCELLGFEFVSRSPTYATEDGVELFHWAWLRRGGAQIMLNTAYDEGERPDAPHAARLRAHDDTSFYFDCKDLDKAYAEVLAFGIACKPPAITGYGFRALSFNDPDGFGIILHHKL